MHTTAPTFIARRFHEEYEALAPRIGYETRRESAVPWEDVPDINRHLMTRVVTRLIASKVIVAGPAWHELVADERRNHSPKDRP